MNRILAYPLFSLGLACIAWVGWSFIHTSELALAMTLLIGLFYLLGAFELHQFQEATHSLDIALHATPAAESLDPWLQSLPPSLQNAVRLRVEGGRMPLPAPALTPYLLGLLVMLGMLGTFLGMVVTFKGAVFAVEGATDFQTIRTALAAPIKGLGLSFGTSVAGVAGSAILGLLSAVARRERGQVSQRLDHTIATTLRAFSRPFQREQALQALLAQMHTLPQVVHHLEVLMTRMDERSHRLGADLAQQQEQFHRDTSLAYTDLARSVGSTLRDSLRDSALAASDGLQPIVTTAMTGIAEASARQHAQLAATVGAQLAQAGGEFQACAQALAESFAHALQNQTQSSEALSNSMGQTVLQFSSNFEHRTRDLLSELGNTIEQFHAARQAADHASHADWLRTWGGMAAHLRHDWHEALARTMAQQQATGTALEQTASTVAELARMHAQQDQRALDERNGIVERLNAVMASAEQSASLHRETIQALASATTSLLSQTGAQLTQTLESQTQAAASVAAHVNASAIELSSLGESFQYAITLFNESSHQLVASLQNIETALHQSMARSDDQLSYYVGQAREVIDLSLSAQQAVVEDLRRLQRRPAPVAQDAG